MGSDQDGINWKVIRCKDEESMRLLRSIFPEGMADSMNFVLFSTSGIHGSYSTIEDAETSMAAGEEEDSIHVTFLIVRPRVVALQFGNCLPRTAEDFAFLKALRQSSWDAVTKIGR